jgi:hypothetical protein
VQSVCVVSLREQFKQIGYVELCDREHGASTFDSLYTYFDALIEFFQKYPMWAQKLYNAKERFIRSKERSYYSTDFFGFYDESERTGRSQISFYYSVHFHEFICTYYPEFNQVPEMVHFFEVCLEMHKSYVNLFNEIADELGVEATLFLDDGTLPILLKIVKYFPSYVATRPHYDGTAFSLFLDSTHNQSLLLSPYKFELTVDDFSPPLRKFSRLHNQNSIILIPGTLLTEFFIDPTPHIVIHSGITRYAIIAFAMRPNYISQKKKFSLLPDFKH